MIEPGKTIIGKWNSNKYSVLEKIGQGAIGTVYKVKDSNGTVMALKISQEIGSITREYSSMKDLGKIRCVPRIYDIDDYILNNNTYYFFTMDYIEGESIKNILKRKNTDLKEVLKLGVILLNILEEIFKEGYIYNDIKLENFLIDKRSKKVVFVDFGGVTCKEYSVREYTPTYNMISWGVRSTNKYPENIIFGVTMIMISLILKAESNPLLEDIRQIYLKIRALTIDESIKRILINGLKANYKELDIYRSDLRWIIANYKSSIINRTRKLDLVNIIFMFSISFFIFTVIVSFTIYK